MGPTSSKEQIEAYVNEVWPDYLRDLERLVAVPSVVDESASAPGAPWGPGCREALDVAMDIAERQGLIVGDCDPPRWRASGTRRARRQGGRRGLALCRGIPCPSCDVWPSLPPLPQVPSRCVRGGWHDGRPPLPRKPRAAQLPVHARCRVSRLLWREGLRQRRGQPCR